MSLLRVAAVASVAALGLSVAGCPSAEAPPADGGADPTVQLRYRFEKGRRLRYESTTVEHGRFDITIRMRTEWSVEQVDPSGTGTLAVRIEHYRHQAFPPRDLPADVLALNKGLAGARFRLRVTSNGGGVEHLGAEELPAVSEVTIEAVRSTLRSHVLKLPESVVRHGQRWTVERLAGADAGPGAISTRSRWRILSLRRQGDKRMVEMVCLSTMEPRPMKLRGGEVVSSTEFHYQYLFDAAAGILEGLHSSGSTTIQARGVPDAGSGMERTTFEARLRLLSSTSR